MTQAQGDKYELLAITAAVLGGTSLFGGLGTIWGSVLGAVLLSSIQIGLVLIGVPGSFYVTFIGVMLVVVVIANTQRRPHGGRRQHEPTKLTRAAPAPGRRVDRTVPPVFELNQVSHSYGRNKVIFDVNLSVWPGEVVGLVGDNGAGKSTLLKIFAGYQKPTGGQLKFLGKPVRSARRPMRARMGIEAVYQDLAMVDQLNLWQNFYLGKETQATVRAAHGHGPQGDAARPRSPRSPNSA